MKLLKLVPDNTNIDFMKWRNVALVLSILMTAASIAITAYRGLNLGIDFVGGQVVRATFAQQVDIEDLRGKVSALNVGDASSSMVYSGASGKSASKMNKPVRVSLNVSSGAPFTVARISPGMLCGDACPRIRSRCGPGWTRDNRSAARSPIQRYLFPYTPSRWYQSPSRCSSWLGREKSAISARSPGYNSRRSAAGGDELLDGRAVRHHFVSIVRGGWPRTA